MLRIPNFIAVNVRHRLRNFPNPIPFLLSVSVAASLPPLRNRSPSQMAARESMMADYAKSGKSSCRACSQKIEAKALRLASVSKGNGPYDIVKWHHLRCFPLSSHSHSSPESIRGFSSLKSSDQEALKKLFAENNKSEEKVNEAVEDVRNELQETGERGSKRLRLCTPDVKAVVNIKFSVSDVKSNYKDATLLPKWKAFQTVIFLERDDGLHDSSKIAAFDFDGCLVKTDVKRVGADAWSLMHSSIPDKLQSLYNDGYKLVIFTNESNIERWKNKRQVAVDSKIGRLNNFIVKVKVPVQVFIACGVGSKSGKVNKKEDDPFRKPKPGMWHLMEQHFNSGIAIDMDKSFFVGDAAGRESDHSVADIKFAEAIGLKFYVPEEYFA
ncbi:polynucleotide 3'-phosphatase ZDP-like isoform X10 [Glycine soja]|uniref:Polynucleotide 3'-phosphatase ZDP isoform C n=1 Tax=Glycine soja TaxID=3848 RepID=A0A445HQU6_GLYSO|nr:polynucleotide 3'-phosphatase ZDP isoform X6 [Glycine max]XP_028194290.1 polynucleotide 3'-phosphatase ZDP-like isoform X10 [Glycine soja]RZB76047.1 Polynucleotide 3'-phosphatase ZDP isoform C [Glycine soja]|eukprot:XP_006592536.1 polynucleotide 3'-phosphatase ZDP isoform X6 [Glycine max]